MPLFHPLIRLSNGGVWDQECQSPTHTDPTTQGTGCSGVGGWLQGAGRSHLTHPALKKGLGDYFKAENGFEAWNHTGFSLSDSHSWEIICLWKQHARKVISTWPRCLHIWGKSSLLPRTAPVQEKKKITRWIFLFSKCGFPEKQRCWSCGFIAFLEETSH